MQMLLAAMLVDALKAALEDTVVAFQRVRIGIATHVLFDAVIDRLVACEALADFLVVARLVRHQGGLARYVRHNDGADCGEVRFVDVEGANRTAALDQRKHRALMLRAASGRRALLAPNKRLVSFNHLTFAAQRRKLPGAHSLTDAVSHEPRTFVRHAQQAMQLMTAKALLAGGQQERGLQPFEQRDMAGLVHGADLDRELLAALVALLQARTGRLALQLADLGRICVAAMRACRAVRPEQTLKKGVSGGFIVKIELGQDGHDGPRFNGPFLVDPAGCGKYIIAKIELS